MPAGRFEWRGDEFLRLVEGRLAARMDHAGRAGVEAARALVPVRSGRTKASLAFAYDRAARVLRITAGTPWAASVEMGTSRAPARPFLRPGLIAAGRAFRGAGGNA
jgi:hypothetical protein